MNWRKIDHAAKDGRYHLLAWRVLGYAVSPHSARGPSWWNKQVGFWDERRGCWDNGNYRELPEPAYYMVLDDPEPFYTLEELSICPPPLVPSWGMPSSDSPSEHDKVT